MSEILCPQCVAKGSVVVKAARSEKGTDVKYFECSKCGALWTNSVDIVAQPVGA